MAVDGKKTFKLTATLTCELPASLAIEQVGGDLTTLFGAAPRLEVMQVDPDGHLSEAPAELHEFFFEGGREEYWIEEQRDPTDE